MLMHACLRACTDVAFTIILVMSSQLSTCGREHVRGGFSSPNDDASATRSRFAGRCKGWEEEK